MLDLIEKKSELFAIYEKYKEVAIRFCNLQEYEAALGLTSAIASLMYNLNFIYKDDELECIIKKCADEYIVNQNDIQRANTNVVVFYDEFGFDTRGVAFIYLKALYEKGYQIVYITRDYRKGKIACINDMLEKDGKHKIIYIERGSYKNETENVLDIIKCYNAGTVFIYDWPQGIVGSLVSNTLRGKGVISYKINLTDHAFWLGARATDYVIEFRDFGANISRFYRGIDENRLIKLPFLPYIDESIEFEGFPFEAENKKIIFSGGGIYKTIGEGNLYYKIVEIILSKYPNVIFWYAGSGDFLYLEELQRKFPEQVFYTEERKDLYQIMKRCYFYLNTYPIAGGLMVQYAVKAGKIPMTLLKNNEGRGIINNAEALECEYRDIEEFMKQIDKIIQNPGYLKRLEEKTDNQVISWKDFSENVNKIVYQHKTDYQFNFQKEGLCDDVSNFVETYLKNFNMNSIRGLIYTKRTKDKLNSIGDTL